jgi:hypothetical protein
MALPLHSREIAQVVAELAERVRQIERPRGPAREDLVSTGSGRFDRLLRGCWRTGRTAEEKGTVPFCSEDPAKLGQSPAIWRQPSGEGGLRRGMLVEWLAGGGADGAGTLAMIAAREAARAGGAIVVVDLWGRFYPPAVVRLGIELETLVVVRPTSDEDHAWALDQVLRTRGVAAAWCTVDEQDDHTLRRWQLAAETSGVIGLLVRPERVRHDPSWAELRLLVEPVAQPHRPLRNRRVRVTLLRSRGGQMGRSVEVEIPTPEIPCEDRLRQSEPRTDRRDTRHGTRAVHLDSRVAAAKAGRRSRRA